MDTTQEDLLRLRRRVKDLLNLGYLSPEAAGTYEQTILLTWQEADRRRVALRQKAETLRLQAAAADAEAGAYTTISSILYNVVNGFVEAGQKRAAEEVERAKEVEQNAKEEAEARTAAQPRKRGRPKKS